MVDASTMQPLDRDMEQRLGYNTTKALNDAEDRVEHSSPTSRDHGGGGGGGTASVRRTIVASRSGIKLMRQISALGMEDPVFRTTERGGPEHPSNIFADMGFNDLPSDMLDMVSIASDHTATNGDGLDLALYRMNLLPTPSVKPSTALLRPNGPPNSPSKKSRRPSLLDSKSTLSSMRDSGHGGNSRAMRRTSSLQIMEQQQGSTVPRLEDTSNGESASSKENSGSQQQQQQPEHSHSSGNSSSLNLKRVTKTNLVLLPPKRATNPGAVAVSAVSAAAAAAAAKSGAPRLPRRTEGTTTTTVAVHDAASRADEKPPPRLNLKIVPPLSSREQQLQYMNDNSAPSLNLEEVFGASRVRGIGGGGTITTDAPRHTGSSGLLREAAAQRAARVARIHAMSKQHHRRTTTNSAGCTSNSNNNSSSNNDNNSNYTDNLLAEAARAMEGQFAAACVELIETAKCQQRAPPTGSGNNGGGHAFHVPMVPQGVPAAAARGGALPSGGGRRTLPTLACLFPMDAGDGA